MTHLPFTRAWQFDYLAQVAETRGFSPDKLVTDAGIPGWHTVEPETPIPTRHLYKFATSCSRALEEAYLDGLSSGSSSVHALGPLGNKIVASPTLNLGLHQLCQSLRDHSSNSYCFMTNEAEHIWLYCRTREDLMPFGLHAMEPYILSIMVGIVRSFAGPDWMPQKISLQSDAGWQPKNHQLTADASVALHCQAIAMAIPKYLLPLAGSNRIACEFDPCPYCDESLASDGVVGSIEQLIGSMLALGNVTAGDLSSALDISKRSLQRVLAREGVSFRYLLEKSRFRIAQRMLRAGDLRIVDIAMELGYTDAANFTHAFRRWAGVSPQQYRRFLC